jgi:hypothetical protein
MLCPRRLVEEKLGFGEDGFLAGDKYERPDLVRKRGAAGLAGDEVGDPLGGEVGREPPDLRRLAGTFDSLEGDENPFSRECDLWVVGRGHTCPQWGTHLPCFPGYHQVCPP